jgi:hypothetical protein
VRDRVLLEEARAEAQHVLEAGDATPTTGSMAALRAASEDRFGGRISWLERV